MLWFRNLLITFGAFWVSSQLTVPFAWVLIPLNNRLVYGDSLPSTITMGIMNSMGTAIAAALGATLVMFFVTGLRPAHWAFVLGLLYAFRHLHYHGIAAPGSWDRWWMWSFRLWPSVACIATAILIARLRRKPGIVERAQ